MSNSPDAPTPAIPLLDIQTIDLAGDAERDRFESLPERAQRGDVLAAIETSRVVLERVRGERVALEESETKLAESVSAIVKDIETAEVERYSGKRKGREGAEEHEASQARLRAKQAEYEEQEMALLESIEDVDGQIMRATTALEDAQAKLAQCDRVISSVQAEVNATLERLAGERAAIAPRVPEKILAAYDRVREQKGKGGRGASTLVDGSCTACRIKLPSLEKTRMLAEPEDAVIQCPQCRRVLLRV